MDSSWCSLISIESLVVPSTPMGLPGLDLGPVPKKARMSESKQENSAPLETASVYKEQAAQFQSLQAKVRPHQPGAVVVQPPKRLPPEAETDRRMYVPHLDQAITHRDVFNFFSSFGDLERVCVKNGTDNLNYAMVLFCRTRSMEQAIKSNPHLIKGHQLNGRKAKEKSTNKGSQQINKPKSTITQLLKAPVMQAQKDDSKRAGHHTLEKHSKSTRYRSLLLQKLVEPNSIKLVTASKTDRNYAYAVTMLDEVSRWSFNLSKSIPSLDEMRALEKGLSRSAKLLLRMRKKLAAVPHQFAIQEAPNCPQTPPSSKAVPKDDEEVAPPAPLASDPMLPSLPLLLTITPQVPLPKSVIPELAKPDLRSVVLSSLGQNYVHHCYTNVEAYRRTKNYIDLLPCEMIERPSIGKYVDQMYAGK
ncbi:uncharacterized protein LOC120452050 [Drosophila santomea]|uniref:uncharacterized protein LOC120452050 n=1 Tax=Drosophila santomea TaxID=129105 RepID=UPI0019544012|nr:uncharacterized protein LOC120452050 [Drosophila santomea]XP_039492048.1 uncharacterized protein LOC120452050 [Drosophila santomea]XP_039492049.1 uncharacterized protein LOC120452050 [Drosophila santomea]